MTLPTLLAQPIKTKLIIEIQPARFFSLGFGDITESEANVVCVSSFVEEIDHTLDYFAAHQIDLPMDGDSLPAVKAGNCYLFDLPQVDFGFRRLLVICKGTSEQPPDSIATNIRMGLTRAISLVGNLETGLQLDTTAMGVGLPHGGIHSKAAFDIMSHWITNLFGKCRNVDHVRLVSNNPDTFVELFESLQGLKISSTELPFAINVTPSTYEEFSSDIAAALHLMDKNPRQVIVICRTIIESVVRKLCQKRLKRPPTKLYDDIGHLRNNGVIPDYVFSYLQTCRVLGNFSNHSDFMPSNRDAEAVMLLTIRVVEWLIDLKLPKANIEQE